MHERNDLLPVAMRIFPGFGFFGYDLATRLTVQVDAKIDRLLISISAPNEEFMNIFPFILHDENGNEVDKEIACKKVKFSSIYSDKAEEDFLKIFLSGNLIHSKKEICPSLRVDFKESIFVSDISIPNRNDKFFSRSRYINIKAFDGEKCILSYDNMGPDYIINELIDFSKIVGIDISNSIYNVDVFVENFYQKILECIDGGNFLYPNKKLFWLLPSFSESVEWNDYVERICACFVCNELKGVDWGQTNNLRPISNILNSSDRIEKTAVRSGYIMSKIKGINLDIVISKHGIHYANLIQNKEKYLIAMKKLCSVFRELNIPIVICYGSLLGAVRGGGFLPHDDDIDFLYIDGSSTYKEVIENKKIISDLLKNYGINSNVSNGEGNFHVHVNGLLLDLFPCRLMGERIYLMMEKYQYREIDTNLILPESSVEIYGIPFPAPANAEGFLQERYGSGWRVPDPYYEWPWPVKHISTLHG